MKNRSDIDHQRPAVTSRFMINFVKTEKKTIPKCMVVQVLSKIEMANLMTVTQKPTETKTSSKSVDTPMCPPISTPIFQSYITPMGTTRNTTNGTPDSDSEFGCTLVYTVKSKSEATPMVTLKSTLNNTPSKLLSPRKQENFCIKDPKQVRNKLQLKI